MPFISRHHTHTSTYQPIYLSIYLSAELPLLYNCGRIFFLYYHFSLVISYHSVWLGLELFGLVHMQAHSLSAGDHARARRMWQSQMSLKKTQIGNENGVWMRSCPEARGWEFWWFLKKEVSWDLSLCEASWDLKLDEASWDSDLGEASPVVVYRMRARLLGQMERSA